MALTDSSPCLGVLRGISTNAASNNFLPIPCGNKRVLFTRFVFTNASTSMAAATTTAGASVSSGGAGAPSGVVLVTAATGVLTTLTGSTITFTPTQPASSLAVLISPVIPAGTNPSTGAPFGESGIFINMAGTPNVAGTVDCYVYGDFYD